MLAQTHELLHGQGDAVSAALLAAALAGTPLPKPAGHHGPVAADVFELALTRTQVAAICVLVDAAVVADVRTAGTRARGLGGFRAAWQEYLRSAET